MKRGWILLDDGEMHEVPYFVLEHETTFWPPTLPEKAPHQPVQFVSSSDVYRRHEVIEGLAYVFLRDSDATSEVPASVVAWIAKQLETNGGAA